MYGGAEELKEFFATAKYTVQMVMLFRRYSKEQPLAEYQERQTVVMVAIKKKETTGVKNKDLYQYR